MDLENVREAVSEEIDTTNIREAVSSEADAEKIRDEIDEKNNREAMSKEVNIEKIRDEIDEKNIEKVHQAASAHYEDLTKDQKQAAQRFFDAMDEDKDGSISIDEFMNFLSAAGFQTDNHDWLFAELDKDNNGTLSFKELVTFFYVLSRDEYKHLLKRSPSTDVPGRKSRFGRRKVRASGQARQWNMPEFSGLYKKLKSVYKVGKWANENACPIL